ncbi:MAG: alpha-mannosidase [Chloroflexi bacterium]|nr:alpha-mannosidase [Chloroflexota bacterium]
MAFFGGYVINKSKKLYMIGNAHIDPVWLWQWQDGFHETKATFRSALDRMNEYPDFVFVSSSAAIYEWVEESDPEMFAEIQRRVAEGRWKIVGGWWIEPDCNLPGGESFARQGLYGQRYFKEKFGVTAKTGYNVDSFGHNGMLPQILKKSGMDYYVFMRPSPHEKGLPGRLFWWESDDGSRVLTFRIALEYASWGKELERHISNIAAELKDPVNEMLCFYGVGNHGGGPTRENLDSINSLREDPQMPELILASPDEYFETMERKGAAYPVVHDDMQHHASGCYAAHSGVKKWNRTAENRLLAAEKFSILANWLTGQPYTGEFERAWKNVLFNQFHDILAGTSLEAAYDDARDQYGEAMAIASRAMNHAVQALAWKINVEPEPGLIPIAVFNPHAWAVQSNVELEIGGLKGDEILVDDQDRPVAHQFVQSQATAGGRQRLSFVADLPPMGYRLYRMVSRPSQQAFSPVKASQTALENNRFRLEFDPETGYIKSLRDKQRNLEVFIDAAAVPVVIDDPSDTWSHNVFTFNQVVGKFTARKVECVEQGPVKSVIRVTSEYNRSTLIQDFAMFNDRDEIEVSVTVDWHEQHKMLKLRFPVNVAQMKATYEIPYGHIERMANGEEEPGQSWIDLSGISRDNGCRYGLSILNDAKYSYDVNIRDIGLTVLRSPIYAHHMPLVPDPEKLYTYIDQGVQKFNYTLYAHDGSWDEAGTVRKAAELNQRPVALVTTLHKGSLPHCASFVSVEPQNLVISAVKKAEDNDDMIIRCYETAGTTANGVIHLPAFQRTIQASFGPCEIKTFRIPRDPDQPVRETNLLEWEEE